MNEWSAGQILFDDLRLEKAIGAGAFGEVWLARQLSWDRDVAVKRVIAVDEKRISSMEHEAINWLEIGLHPYVTTCYYTRKHENAPVIVLEYASGGALDGLMKDGSLLFEPDAVYQILKYSLEAAWGLACAHKTGLLHLDVKPANILLENGQAKITDFGIASRLGQEITSSGTRAFAPPEQLSRDVVSAKTDVFSWAVSVFALFKHEVSWTVGAAAPELLEDSWALGDFPLNMPEDVYHLLMTCMSEDPAARPTMEEAADDLIFIMQAEFPDIEMPVKVIDRQPLTAAEYNNRAVYMYETGDLEGAEAHFKIAMETAADIVVPQYNRGLVDYYTGRTTPAKLLEANMNRDLGALSIEHFVAAGIYMINGDARSIEEDPELLAASSSVGAWIRDGAPGALDIQTPQSVACIRSDDQQKIKEIITAGKPNTSSKDVNALPVAAVVSTQRKTMLFINDKGVVLLSGLGPGAKPLATCILSGERIELDTLDVLGENAVMYLDKGLTICDFSDPENLIYSPMPYIPEVPAFGDGEMKGVVSLDNVSVLPLRNSSGEYAVVVLDLTNGIYNARWKFEKLLGYSGAFGMLGLEPDIAFVADGSVLIDGSYKITPDEWGGETRSCEDPDQIMSSNKRATARSKILCISERGSVLIRHSTDHHIISDDADRPGFSVDDFEFACRWRIAPYRFVAMVHDSFPAVGGALILEQEGEFFVSRIDKRDTPPPSKADFLMMNAVSGAVAKIRHDVIGKACSDYDNLLLAGAYGEISGITDAIRPLVENGDENALALWMRIARDFPRGKAFMSMECDTVRSGSEVTDYVLTLEPISPGQPFSRPSTIGMIRFKYNKKWNDYPMLAIMNGSTPPREFWTYGKYAYVTGAESSEDGLFQGLVYSEMQGTRKIAADQKGILIRIFDVRMPDYVFELCDPGLRLKDVFMRWSYHTLLMYIANMGVFAIDFDEWDDKYSQLPPPIIPDLKRMHDVAFIGEHADELDTGENMWRICYEILPIPSHPYRNTKYQDMEYLIPVKPDERRAMLLRNGFGNIWTEQIIAGR